MFEVKYSIQNYYWYYRDRLKGVTVLLSTTQTMQGRKCSQSEKSLLAEPCISEIGDADPLEVYLTMYLPQGTPLIRLSPLWVLHSHALLLAPVINVIVRKVVSILNINLGGN